MNYQFNLEEWMQRVPLEHGAKWYSGDAITGPSQLCNNEHLRRAVHEQFSWGEAVPMDVFVMADGEPEYRAATKIGGLPYRPADEPWPTDSGGNTLTFLAQFNFSDSKDIIPDGVDGDLLLVFTDNDDGLVTPSLFEWRELDVKPLVEQSEIPICRTPVEPCYGYRCRTMSFPFAADGDWQTGGKYSTYRGKDVTADYWLTQYQATQIGTAPFFIQPLREGIDGTPLCTISSVQPSHHSPCPWVNRAEPLASDGEWYGNADHLMIGDLGCIYIFIDDNGNLHFDVSCF